MFDLEQAITKWRQQMLAAGIKTPLTLDELEGHLRDDIEKQIRSGLNARKAFRAAVKHLGQAEPLTKEFAKDLSTRGFIIVNLGIISFAACYGSFMMWINNTVTDHAQRLLGLIGIVLTTLIIGSTLFVLVFLHRAFPKERIRRIGFAGMIVAAVGWLGILVCFLVLKTNPSPPIFSLSQVFVWTFIISNLVRVSAKKQAAVSGSHVRASS